MKLGLGAVGLVALYFVGREAGGYLPQFGRWVDSLGFWGPVVFMLGYAVATVAFVPGSLLTLAAGAVFGLLEGTLYVIVGASVGATGAFLVSRYLARGAVERRLRERPKFQAIDQAVGREGLKIVFLMRLSPIFPFNLLNYALGLTDVRLWHYVLACLGMLPGTFLYVYYGKAAGSLAKVAAGAEAQTAGPWGTVLLVVGLIATVIVTTYVTRIARRAVKDEVLDESEGDGKATDEPEEKAHD